MHVGVSYLITLSTRIKAINNVTTVKSVMCMSKCICVLYSASKFEWSFSIPYVCDSSWFNLLCFTGFSMHGIKTSLSVAPVLSTQWFGALAGLLIEINRLFLLCRRSVF
jgi:photosystem I subunit IX